MTLLQLDNVHVFYGDAHILFGISLNVNPGETVCLLGRNGVGKTTAFRAIMGMTPARSGSIEFSNVSISKMPPYMIAQMGIGYVPEDKRLFPSLSVRENLELAARKSQNGNGSKLWDIPRVCKLFPILKERINYKSTQLSGGEQQMLAVARALMSNPALLLVDEPTQGLAPIIQQMLGQLIKDLKGEGLSILLAEQSLTLAMDVSDRAYILEKGSISFDGTISELNKNKKIIEECLGV